MQWKIVQLECKPIEGDLENVAITAHWTVSETDGEHTGSAYGSIGLGDPDPADFTPFADLTEETVIGWVQAALGDQVVAIEAGVTAQIAALVNPPVVTPPLPWVTI